MANEQETWENVGLGGIQIFKFGRNGNPEPFIVKGGAKISLTPDERVYNQDVASTEAGNFFGNGSLMPVRLVDTAADYAEIVENPNHYADSDIEKLLALKVGELRAKLAEIDNPVTIRRVHEVAANTDLTTTKVQAVQDRFDDFFVPENEGIVDDPEVSSRF